MEVIVDTRSKTLPYLLFFSSIVALCAPQPVRADEVSELKVQVQQLREDSKKQQDVIERLMQKIEAIEHREQRVAEDAERVKVQPPQPAEGEPVLSDQLAHVPKLTLKGFAEVGWTAKITGDEYNDSFLTEEIDFFITSELSDRVSALVEADFFSPDSNTMSFGLQRFNLRYKISDLLNVKIGRIHTPFGYWNEVFHHGSWLQTTVGRPEIYRFERDDGGFLPVHSVGLQVSGDVEWAPVDLGYDLSVLSGRGRTVTEVQHVRDKNDSKALGIVLKARPSAVEGLQVGPLIYWDRIPGDPPTTGRTDHIDELILGAHAIYLREPVELLSEFFHIHHDDKTSEKNFDTLGFYLQGAYRLGKTKPYYRFDYLDVANADPYFTGARRIDRTKHTLGLRWDVLNWNALKFEYGFTDRQTSDQEHTFTVNSSFTF